MDTIEQATQAVYTQLKVPGVNQDDIWQLFNVSNWDYYCLKVSQLQSGVCPFCTPDPEINELVTRNSSWNAYRNKIAPRKGQEHQWVVVLRRHALLLAELTENEWTDLRSIHQQLMKEYRLSGCAWVIRDGDAVHNAKSVPHLHVNIHVPTGIDDVEITIGKSLESMKTKLPVLQAFEKMRLLKLEGHPNPLEALVPEEVALVANRMGPPKTAK